MSTSLVTQLKSELSTLHAIVNMVDGAKDSNTHVIHEIMYLEAQALSKPFIVECTKESIVLALRYSLKNKLSMDPNAGLVYLTPLSVKTDKKDATGNDIYVKTLEIKPTADGKLSIAYQAGVIMDHKRPIVKKDATGKVTSVSVDICLPTPGGYRWETTEIDESDFQRFKIASHKKNSRFKADANQKDYSNPLYTSFNGGIDPEFARSKCISTALKKRGTNLNMNMAKENPSPLTPIHSDQYNQDIENVDVIDVTPSIEEKPNIESLNVTDF